MSGEVTLKQKIVGLAGLTSPLDVRRMSVGLPIVLEAENRQNVLSVESDGLPMDFQWTFNGLNKIHQLLVIISIYIHIGLSMDLIKLINYRLLTHTVLFRPNVHDFGKTFTPRWPKIFLLI